MKLSILIVNYKSRGLLREILTRLEQDPPKVPHEVVVVDNGSHDGSAELVRSSFPRVKLTVSEKNLGYAGGTNLGLERCEGEHVLMVNTDVVFRSGAQLDELVHYLDAHQDVGMVGPRLVNADGSLQYSAYRFYHFLTPFYQRTPLGRLRAGQREINRFLMRDWAHDTERPVDWLMSSCIMVRRRALDAIGAFDEGFFIYLSDTDICRRLWEKDWKVMYVPTVELIHFFHRESSSSLKVLIIHIKDWLHYLRKWGHKLPEKAAPDSVAVR